jgi:hypothetical protein
MKKTLFLLVISLAMGHCFSLETIPEVDERELEEMYWSVLQSASFCRVSEYQKIVVSNIVFDMPEEISKAFLAFLRKKDPYKIREYLEPSSPERPQRRKSFDEPEGEWSGEGVALVSLVLENERTKEDYLHYVSHVLYQIFLLPDRTVRMQILESVLPTIPSKLYFEVLEYNHYSPFWKILQNPEDLPTFVLLVSRLSLEEKVYFFCCPDRGKQKTLSSFSLSFFYYLVSFHGEDGIRFILELTSDESILTIARYSLAQLDFREEKEIGGLKVLSRVFRIVSKERIPGIKEILLTVDAKGSRIVDTLYDYEFIGLLKSVQIAEEMQRNLFSLCAKMMIESYLNDVTMMLRLQHLGKVPLCELLQ